MFSPVLHPGQQVRADSSAQRDPAAPTRARARAKAKKERRERAQPTSARRNGPSTRQPVRVLAATAPSGSQALPPTAPLRGDHAEESREADAQVSASARASASDTAFDTPPDERVSRFTGLRGGAGESDHPLSARLHGRGFRPRRIGDDERVPSRLWFFAGGMGNRPRGKNLRAQRTREMESEDDGSERRDGKGQPSLLAFMLGARARGGKKEQETGKDGREAKELGKKESDAVGVTEVKVVKEEVVAMSGALAPADAQAAS
ncbi:hypothetical protein B0A49_10710 [Cryomyces minteri]|uniref:Uncharacterized protein n=1 Tax=Cryomyces minteri TaxID=331657 RepID=A0A4U0VZI3_9PEZI|nr:hypothetical protein B0A49_10710 [Cryomyces minteri]